MPASVNAIQSCLALATPMLRPFPGVASSTRTTRAQSDKERRLIHSSTISGVPSSDPPSTTITSSGRRVCLVRLSIKHSIESASFLTGTTSETFTQYPQLDSVHFVAPALQNGQSRAQKNPGYCSLPARSSGWKAHWKPAARLGPDVRDCERSSLEANEADSVA